jgi:hypothetical protein
MVRRLRPVVLILTILWLLFPLWGAVLGSLFVFDRWILAESSRTSIWVAGVGLIWLLPLPALPGVLAAVRGQDGWKVAGAILAAGALAGWFGGPLIVTLLNCVQNDAESEEVTVESTAMLRTSVRFRVQSGRHAGTSFVCAKSVWGPIDQQPRRATLRTGRLGFLWCSLSGHAR